MLIRSSWSWVPLVLPVCCSELSTKDVVEMCHLESPGRGSASLPPKNRGVCSQMVPDNGLRFASVAYCCLHSQCHWRLSGLSVVTHFYGLINDCRLLFFIPLFIYHHSLLIIVSSTLSHTGTAAIGWHSPAWQSSWLWVVRGRPTYTFWFLRVKISSLQPHYESWIWTAYCQSHRPLSEMCQHILAQDRFWHTDLEMRCDNKDIHIKSSRHHIVEMCHSQKTKDLHGQMVVSCIQLAVLLPNQVMRTR